MTAFPTMFQLLNEISYSQVEQRFKSKKFKNAVMRLKQMPGEHSSYENLYQDFLQEIEDAVPHDIEDKYRGEALNWLIGSFVHATKDVKAARNWERSLPHALGHLEIFYQMKAQGVDVILEKNNIYDIPSIGELIRIVNDAEEEYHEHMAARPIAGDASAGMNLIGEDDEWKIFIPETHAAACYLGKGTRWCTAAPGLKKYYNQYHKKNDPLIIFKHKQDSRKDVQIHFDVTNWLKFKGQVEYDEDRWPDYEDYLEYVGYPGPQPSFMDVKDEPLDDPEQFVRILKKFATKLPSDLQRHLRKEW